MNIRPLYDRIVVKRIEEQETKIGGLFIPDSAKEKPQEGEVSRWKGQTPGGRQSGSTGRGKRQPHPVRQILRQ